MAQRERCSPTHARKVGGTWVPGENDRYELVVQGNGVGQISVRCTACGARCGFLPYAVWQQWQAAGAVLSSGRVHESNTYPPCSYAGCEAEGRQVHHFAPWNTFGPDAENWPTAPFCQTHHQLWHRTMDGYRWHRKGVAA
jgi:hypothetical protein